MKWDSKVKNRARSIIIATIIFVFQLDTYKVDQSSLPRYRKWCYWRAGCSLPWTSIRWGNYLIRRRDQLLLLFIWWSFPPNVKWFEKYTVTVSAIATTSHSKAVAASGLRSNEGAWIWKRRMKENVSRLLHLMLISLYLQPNTVRWRVRKEGLFSTSSAAFVVVVWFRRIEWKELIWFDSSRSIFVDNQKCCSNTFPSEQTCRPSIVQAVILPFPNQISDESATNQRNRID